MKLPRWMMAASALMSFASVAPAPAQAQSAPIAASAQPAQNLSQYASFSDGYNVVIARPNIVQFFTLDAQDRVESFYRNGAYVDENNVYHRAESPIARAAMNAAWDRMGNIASYEQKRLDRANNFDVYLLSHLERATYTLLDGVFPRQNIGTQTLESIVNIGYDEGFDALYRTYRSKSFAIQRFEDYVSGFFSVSQAYQRNADNRAANAEYDAQRRSEQCEALAEAGVPFTKKDPQTGQTVLTSRGKFCGPSRR